MDNLTHGLVGAALARTVGRRAVPLATTTGVIAANAPDIDVLAFMHGPYYALAFRRGLTHGWPALMLLTVLVAAGVLLWDRQVRRRWTPSTEPARAGPILLLSALGVASHPVLDWMNTYGLRWAMPFRTEWSYGDTLFIIDPWIWLALGGALFVTAPPTGRSRIVWGALAVLTSTVVFTAPVTAPVKALWALGVALLLVVRRGGRIASRSPALVAGGTLAGVGVYIVLGIAANRLARAEVRAVATAQGVEILDVMVSPRPGTPFASDVEVRTTDGYLPGAHGWLRRPRVTLAPEALVPERSVPPGLTPSDAEWIVAAAHLDPDVRHYLTWSRYPITRITPHPEGWRVSIGDARYDDRSGAGSLGGVETIVRAPLTSETPSRSPVPP